MNAPSDSLFINFNGRVGLGTQTPQGNLHISGQATADLFSGIGPNLIAGPAFNFGYSGSSFGRGSGFFNVRPDASATGPNPSLRFATQNIQRMIIDKNGNVGIGQFGAAAGSSPGTSPVEKLHVQGNIRADGSFIANGTTLSVPDYVFEPEYKLLPLTQLAAYIEQEKHLPEVPSADEIKARGMNLSEMQLQLLKKVEELTLYTVQQERTIDAQQHTISTQAEIITKLHDTLKGLDARVRNLEGRQEQEKW
ncbi:MAG: hypothetical protein AB7G75_31170 [Candidatus Binatia bacterium]